MGGGPTLYPLVSHELALRVAEVHHCHLSREPVVRQGINKHDDSRDPILFGGKGVGQIQVRPRAT